eukprot:977050-Amphidinium_carterae.2
MFYKFALGRTGNMANSTRSTRSTVRGLAVKATFQQCGSYRHCLVAQCCSDGHSPRVRLLQRSSALHAQ